jgi:phytoene dehydrogenase-like protein
MKTLAAVLTRYSKFIAAIIGAITEAVNLGYVPDSAQKAVSLAVAILTALGVVGVSNGPALADGTAIANDLASLKEQIGPLPAKGGLVSVTKHLAQIAEQHGKNLEAIVEAAKVDIQDLLHQPAVSMDPPTTEAAPLTLSEAPTPVAEPASQSQMDAVGELSKLVP